MPEFNASSQYNGQILRTSWGQRTQDYQNSRIAAISQQSNDNGLQVLMDNLQMIENLNKFNREKIVERQLFAKGTGAHGYFELSNDVSKYTRAKFLNGKSGKQTPIFARFSPSMINSKGFPDTVRDIKSFDIKFYTEDGNFDLMTQNSQVTFIRDAAKYPDFIHSQKNNPQSNLKDYNSTWDFLSQTTESINMLMRFYGAEFIPDGYQQMNTYGQHTYKWINDKNEFTYVRYHLINNLGQNFFLIDEQAMDLFKDPDYFTSMLFNQISQGNFPTWTLKIQIMTQDDALKSKYDIFDSTKTWDAQLITVGNIVLNKNPQNNFAEVEQVAFNRGHFVDGIDSSGDRLLQGLIFMDQDSNLFRLGSNYDQIPINKPYKVKQISYSRDGASSFTSNFGNSTNYYPNTLNGPIPDASIKPALSTASSTPSTQKTYDDFTQASQLYKDMSKYQKEILAQTLVKDLKQVKKSIQQKAVDMFNKVDVDLGSSINNQL
ncbi:catalase [Stylonychia lemnae]|uniref:Catalase n=1 Tax=Stylonychia lemnae TaxID=5949 RepID=A0A078AYB7_STYLE|nr:catalase [Stylonychia lemnae]|eukprot:CDW87159.1 catalase [Stylonychia lemnae]